MKKIILTLLLFYVSNTFSQSVEEKNSYCTKTKNLSLQTRLTKFPFFKASSIKIISLKNKSNDIVGVELIKHVDSIRIGIDKFKSEFYDEVVELNPKQIDKLSDIIFNYSFKKKPYVISEAMCYNPRNAIFFLDKNNVVIAYLELCFGCDNHRASSEEFGIGDYCDKKYDMIKEIFKDGNIKYGITEVEQ